jgi:hypothetical protein
MTSEQRARINELCQCIQDEQNPAKFMALVEELNVLLENKSARLSSVKKTDLPEGLPRDARKPRP